MESKLKTFIMQKFFNKSANIVAADSKKYRSYSLFPLHFGHMANTHTNAHTHRHIDMHMHLAVIKTNSFVYCHAKVSVWLWAIYSQLRITKFLRRFSTFLPGQQRYRTNSTNGLWCKWYLIKHLNSASSIHELILLLGQIISVIHSLSVDQWFSVICTNATVSNEYSRVHTFASNAAICKFHSHSVSNLN